MIRESTKLKHPTDTGKKQIDSVSVEKGFHFNFY